MPSVGDPNQLQLVANLKHCLAGPFLEVGSKDYGSTQNLRRLFQSQGPYVGIDMEAGDGVDIVLDMTSDFSVIDEAVGRRRFGTIFCLSVLEHCDQPFRMAEHMTRLLKPGGAVVVSVPFAWKFHGYPSDYWRFTHEGIKKLFPQLVFDMGHAAASRGKSPSFETPDENLGRINFSSKSHWEQGHYVRGVTARGFRLLARLGIFKWLADSPYVLAPTMVFMVGTLPAAAQSQAA